MARRHLSASPLSVPTLALWFTTAIPAQIQENPDNPPAPGASRAQSTAPVASSSIVQFGPHISIQVNIDSQGNNIPGDAANEPSLSIDPTDPSRIVIGWRQFDTINSNFRKNGWSYSHDGGTTWAFPGSIEPNNFNSDPVIGTNSNGRFYYVSYPSGITLRLFSSDDGGLTWSGPTIAPGGDKAWMSVDRTGGMGDGHIYFVWQVLHGPNTFTRSTNGGASFMTPVSVPSSPTFGAMHIAANGDVYAAGRSGSGTSLVVARSVNAKDAEQSPTFQTRPVDLGGTMRLGASPNPGGLLGQVNVATDPTRPGHVYVLCSVNPPGPDPLDVHFARSTDNGQTFDPWVRVNDDPAGTNAWQWFGTMAVAPNGRIDALWNDTRNNVSTMCRTYYAYSLDGGTTWSRNIPITSDWDSTLGHPNQNKIGDYYDMASDNATASVAYSATFNGEQDVYFVRLGDCNGNQIHDGVDLQNGTSFDSNLNTIPDECEVCQPDLGSGSGLNLRICGDELTRVESRATLEVFDGAPNTEVFLLFSPERATPPVALPGGAGLVPSLLSPIAVVLAGQATDSRGRFGLPLSGGTRTITTLYAQAAMLSGSLLVSNAVQLEIGL